jgi:LysR family transcriptional regulator, glycine cleavage system transcriptional activator
MMSKPDSPSPQALPLNAVRVFVEAARQLNFSRAGRMLGMSQGGVSRHVATLERYFGQPLFARSGTSVRLTDAGRLYFDTVQEALSTIELATRQLAQSQAGARLIVRTSLPTFAMTALIPALTGFLPATPVAVDLVTSLSPPGPGDSYDVLVTRDLAIAGAEHWLLGAENLVCVASPARCREFANRPISQWQFLAAQSRPDVLAAWSAQLGLQAAGIHVSASFDHYFLAIAAATGGMGHLVVPELLVAEPLRQGHLLRASPQMVRGDASYSAYINPRSPVPEAGRAFCRWLKGWFREALEPPTSAALQKP